MNKPVEFSNYMALSSRDIEKIQSKPFKEPWFIRFFVPFFKLLTKVPYLNKKISNSSGGLAGRIFRCWDKNEYKKAVEISIFALERFRHKKDKCGPGMEHHTWWQFMKHGVDSAKHICDQELKDKLRSMAEDGIQPFEGYDVAYSYLEFSRWAYHSKQYEMAVSYANMASKADNTWAEPEFILGWYALILGMGDAVEHLSAAIERDQRVLFRVANNDVCKQYPHIINKLKSKYSGLEFEGEPNQ